MHCSGSNITSDCRTLRRNPLKSRLTAQPAGLGNPWRWPRLLALSTQSVITAETCLTNLRTHVLYWLVFTNREVCVMFKEFLFGTKADMVERGLILAAIVATAMAAWTTLGGNIKAKIEAISTQITSSG